MKKALLFTFRWINALLFAFHAFEFIRDTCNAEHVLNSRAFPASLGSVGSFLMIASLSAFLGAKQRDNVMRRSFAKSANIAALAFCLYWSLSFWRSRGFGGLSLEETAASLLVMCFVLGVPLLNSLFFWRAPAPPVADATVAPEIVPVTPPELIPTAPDPEPPAPAASGNFFLNHWRGLLSLGVSFWVNGWLVVATILAAQKLLDDGSIVRRARVAAVLYTLTYLVALAAGLWVVVGVWRSATRHVRSGRRPVWGSLAKLAVLLLVLSQVGQIVWFYLPKAREHLHFASGEDPFEPYQIQVSANGEIIELRGGLRFGSAHALESVLASLPGAKVLKIDSPGGRVNEALKMMAVVHDRGLNTYASQRCMSAATLVLTAGKHRGAELGTQVGFHACRSPAGSSTSGDASVMGGLVSVGVAETFVHRVLRVPPNQMWFPTPQEMLEAGVLTSYGVFPPDKMAPDGNP